MQNTYQELVRETIPLTQYMDWQIKTLSPMQIHSQTMLAPNINIHGTAFAGSIYAAAMATGWTLMKCWYDSNQYQAELVAAEANIKYLRPVTSDFECLAQITPESDALRKLISRLEQNRSCGFPVKIEIICQNQLCAILEVSFVFKCS